MNQTSMVFLHSCPIHQQPRDTVCGMHQCSQLLCRHCLPSHQLLTDHHLAICLNAHALNYFTLFSQHVHDTILTWIHNIRIHSFSAVFAINSKEGSLCQNSHIQGQMSNLALLVLEEHKDLMLANRNYVESNKDSELLYHPQCIKDIFNLIVYPWEANAHIILLKLNTHLQQALPYLSHPLHISLRPQLILEIQKHRNQLIAPHLHELIIDLKAQSQANKRDSSGEIDTNGSENSEVLSPQSEISQFHIAQGLHIKVIDSYQHIEHQTPSPPLKAASLLQENRLLLQQNSLLKIENLNLKQENCILKDKCEKIQLQRRQMPSSSKKRSEANLNSQLLAEIVQLQCQVNDNRHDLHLLIAYLNQLSTRNVIPPEQLHHQLLPLRTITLR